MDWNVLNVFLIIFTCSLIQSGVSGDETVDVPMNFEITFDGRNRTKRTGYKGDTLVVGKRITVELPAFTYYNFDYRCAIAKISDRIYFSFDWNVPVTKGSSLDEPIDTSLYNDYFVHTLRKQWNCTHVNGKSASFYRVENEYISKKEILEVVYPEHIEVSSVNYLSNQRRTRIKEILYIYKNTTNNVATPIPFNCSGKLVVEMPKDGSESIFYLNSVRKPVYPGQKGVPLRKADPARNQQNGAISENYVDQKGASYAVFTRHFSETGSTLRIGSSQRKNHVLRLTTGQYYTCTRLQGILPIPYHFLTEISIEVKSNPEVYARISEQDFAKYFAIIRNTVWLCQLPNSGSQFYRVVTEVMGIDVDGNFLNIKKIYYEPEIVEIEIIETYTGKETIRFKDISFFEVETGKRLKLDKSIYYKLAESPKKYEFTYGNKNFRDITHRLSHQSVYKILVNEEGYDIRVGSRATTVFELPAQLSCSQVHSRTFVSNMVFKLKVYDGVCNTMKEVEDDRLEGYYKYLSREVWLCTSTTTTRRKTQTEETLYRVLNKVEILVKVREIETFDGVEVALKNSTKRVQINEVKYFAIQKKEFVIVDGSIDIELDFIPYQDINDGVSKDEWDETVRQFGHMPMNLHYRLKDFDPDEVSADRSLIIGDTENKLYFNSDENVVMGDVNQTVTCKLMPNGVKPYPKFNVSGVANALIDEMTNVYNRTTHAKYFNAIDTEVRLCRSRNNKYVFVRVKTVQTLQKDGIARSIAKILPTQLDEAWIEMKGNDFDLKMVSIRYYTGLSKPKDVDYEGYVLMADTSSKWKSGSVTYIEAFTIKVEKVFGIDHTLQLRTRYTYTLYMQPYVRSEQQNLITLWIGSKWTKQITAKNVICNEEQLGNGERKLKLQTIVREELSNGTIINSNLTEYFDLLGTKLWKCTNEENLVMYRVMNHIQLKSVQARNLKKMIYFDGIYHFGITFGSDLHFQIVEVKYLDRSFNIVYQFDGKVVLNNAVQSDTDAGVSPIVLSKYCCAKSEVTIYLKDETTYFLRNLEVYRLPTNQGMDNEKGLILEIGQAIRGYDVLVNYRIIIQDCKKQSQLKKDYLPKVVILQDSTAAKLGIDDYKQYFISEQEYYKCETAASKIQLVKNRLTLKDGYSMHAVYIHQGVKVNLETKSFVETKVYKKDKNEWFNFGGFYPQLSSPKDGAKATLESRLNYHLDFLKASTIVRTKKLSLEGINIEILSPPFNREINDTTKVECIRQMTDHTLTELLPEIKFAQKVGEGQFIWTRHDLKTSDYLTFEQEVWRCSAKDGYTTSTLYRVLNRIATMKEVGSIYYSGAIAVDEKQLHSLEGGNNKNEEVIKYNVITDQKLVESLEGVTLKGETRPTFNYINYDGRFRLLTNCTAGEKRIINKLFNRPGSAPRDDERSDALKDLMLYALIQFKKYGNDGGLEALPRVIANNGNLTTKIINKNAHRVFQIGSRYEKTVDVRYTRRSILCTLDKWSELTGSRYSPKVEEQIDDKYYELYDEDFHEVFQMINLEVWLCTNQLVEFVRVVSTFKPKIPILAVTLYDSVQCEERPSINIDDVLFRPLISEIIYLNTTDSKVLRYDGALKFKPAEEYSTKSTKTQSGLSKAFCCFQGK